MRTADGGIWAQSSIKQTYVCPPLQSASPVQLAAAAAAAASLPIGNPRYDRPHPPPKYRNGMLVMFLLSALVS